MDRDLPELKLRWDLGFLRQNVLGSPSLPSIGTVVICISRTEWCPGAGRELIHSLQGKRSEPTSGGRVLDARFGPKLGDSGPNCRGWLRVSLWGWGFGSSRGGSFVSGWVQLCWRRRGAVALRREQRHGGDGRSPCAHFSAGKRTAEGRSLVARVAEGLQQAGS